MDENAKNSNKGLSHYDLQDALRGRGCAVCRLVKRRGHRYLDNLLYELVNDPGMQREFRTRSGCATGTPTGCWTSATASGRPPCTAFSAAGP